MKGWKAWTAFAAAALFLGLLGFGLTRSPADLPSALVGKPAPAFAGQTLEGDSLSLAELRGEVVILNFWASWCVPCRQEHAVLERAASSYRGEGARVVGVVYQDTRRNAVRFMQSMGGDWPSVLDPASRVAIDYGVYGVPETFFLSSQGTVARKHIGPVTWDVVTSTVDSLLATAPAGSTGSPGAEDGASGTDAGTS